MIEVEVESGERLVERVKVSADPGGFYAHEGRVLPRFEMYSNGRTIRSVVVSEGRVRIEIDERGRQ